MAIKKTSQQHKTFGLIGKNSSYSFSKNHFSKKFESERIENTSYVNFDLDSIDEFSKIFKSTHSIQGLNVTIPYKGFENPYFLY